MTVPESMVKITAPVINTGEITLPFKVNIVKLRPTISSLIRSELCKANVWKKAANVPCIDRAWLPMTTSPRVPMVVEELVMFMTKNISMPSEEQV